MYNYKLSSLNFWLSQLYLSFTKVVVIFFELLDLFLEIYVFHFEGFQLFLVSEQMGCILLQKSECVQDRCIRPFRLFSATR